jgi:predicted RNA-binding Zn-ribbon protein involved in translation (DUF1610 family)
MATVEVCTDCGSRLSRYRTARERQCAPCQQRRIDRSIKHAHEPQAKPTRSQEAFALRWRGYEWEPIARIVTYPNPQAAQSAARDYAKRKGLTLP